MNIPEYIASLLYEHDCVIVPNLGGFVGNYSPAAFSSSEKHFFPPSKKITFNINLKTSDGLLANYISTEEKIPYNEAIEKIKEFNILFHEEIKANKRFYFEKIGLFYLGEEDKLLFRQDERGNFLPGSFGMFPIYVSTIEREPLQRKAGQTIKGAITFTPQDKTLVPAPGRKIPYRKYTTLAASLLLLAAISYFFFQTEWIKNTNLADLNPFSVKEKPLYLPPQEIAFPVIENPMTDDNRKKLDNVSDESSFISLSFGTNKQEIIARLKTETSSDKSVLVSKINNTQKFHVIGGAFEVRANADRLLEKMKSNGYNAKIIRKGNRLLCVAYGSFFSREEALSLLVKVRSEEPKAWLWKK
jgi:hypothetical protein